MSLKTILGLGVSFFFIIRAGTPKNHTKTLPKISLKSVYTSKQQLQQCNLFDHECFIYKVNLKAVSFLIRQFFSVLQFLVASMVAFRT